MYGGVVAAARKVTEIGNEREIQDALAAVRSNKRKTIIIKRSQIPLFRGSTVIKQNILVAKEVAPRQMHLPRPSVLVNVATRPTKQAPLSHAEEERALPQKPKNIQGTCCSPTLTYSALPFA